MNQLRGETEGEDGQDRADGGRRTTERVLELLGLLRQRQMWSGPELAERLRVTTRTVRRDVERLRRLGYPVHTEAGAQGGYRLGPGRELPPLLLDDQEAVATALSLLAGAGSVAGADPDAALRALGKLDQVLPTRVREQVRTLSGAIGSFGDGRVPIPAQVLLTLARACRDHTEAGFRYPVRGAGRSCQEVRPDARTEHPDDQPPAAGIRPAPEHRAAGPRRDPDATRSLRRVEPYRLVSSERHWYLFAFDLDRADWRTFRVDRMTEVNARTWRFAPRPTPDPVAYVQEAVSNRAYPSQARFLVHAPADTVRVRLPSAAAVVHDRGPDRCEIRSGAVCLDAVLLHVLSLGIPFEVLEPADLTVRAGVLGRLLLAAGG